MSAVDTNIVDIREEGDIVSVRQLTREVASGLGFGVTDTTRIVTAASELARNVFKYGGGGTMTWRELHNGSSKGIELTFEDQGPGIEDMDSAMSEGFSTGGGLGMGLPGAKKLMDDLVLDSQVGQGTKVVVRKWQRGI